MCEVHIGHGVCVPFQLMKGLMLLRWSIKCDDLVTDQEIYPARHSVKCKPNSHTFQIVNRLAVCFSGKLSETLEPAGYQFQSSPNFF